MSLKKDLSLLSLESTVLLTPAVVKTRFRELAAEHHPDKGGDPATFHEMRLAHDRLIAYLEKPKRCVACRGAGKINISKTRTPLMTRCSACRGKGTVSSSSPLPNGLAADRGTEGKIIIDEAKEQP